MTPPAQPWCSPGPSGCSGVGHVARSIAGKGCGHRESSSGLPEVSCEPLAAWIIRRFGPETQGLSLEAVSERSAGLSDLTHGRSARAQQ